MPEHQSKPNSPVVIRTGDELMQTATRRRFMQMMSLGGAAVLMPAVFSGCSMTPLPGQAGSAGLTFDLRSDIGIFRLVHTLEQLEAAFYTAVVGSPNFSSYFNAAERELFTDLRNVEIVHREFVRTALGSQAVPDITGAINGATLATILSSRQNILSAARMFEHFGVSGLNGAGKYIQDPRNLLLAGKFVSVEARHAAALRDVSPPAGQGADVAFASDDIVDANGMDVKLEAGALLDRVAATNLVIGNAVSSGSITHAPTARQGKPSANFFPSMP